ncbi:MAG: hypothetical protein AVDCRST_MAG34-1775 [uncultured Nocardioidaceae bacterium]|uniref:DUF2630 family protein n=1 Tax=uncultured Nocardioidaceae bacterium TaxID=253824 RepID=A0A6J4M6D7_9ACTN|nr:MAG: hypothetical protein AVDCRST_MAG34-1775 [uncultured Nocardioidaceae bacterium]
MDDDGIMRQVNALIEREHELRTARQNGTVAEEDELRELGEVEVQLDQCWDLLRQRRAKREFGGDPDEAQPRPSSVVERYWQ